MVENGSKFPKLQSINLGGNLIGIEGLKALAKNDLNLDKLKEIHVYNNQI